MLTLQRIFTRFLRFLNFVARLVLGLQSAPTLLILAPARGPPETRPARPVHRAFALIPARVVPDHGRAKQAETRGGVRNRRPTLETTMQHRAESLLEALFHTLLTLVLVLSLPALYRLDDMAAAALAQAGMILAHYLIRRGFLRHEVCAPGACDRAVEAETIIERQRQILQLRSAELANLGAHRMSLENDLHRTRAELSEARRALRKADKIDEHELLA